MSRERAALDAAEKKPSIFEDILKAKRQMECLDKPAQSIDLGYDGIPQPDPVAMPLFGQSDLSRFDRVFGIRIQQSNFLPLVPDHKEDARRIVRHGLKDVLEWLGEPVGPAPGEQIHAILTSDIYSPGATSLLVSRDFDHALRRSV